jgi:hypothetical protein
LKHLHRSHHPNRRTHEPAPSERHDQDRDGKDDQGHDRSHFLHGQNNGQSKGHGT